ncbi:MAG: magnesium transporter CorA family protein [Candidatus Velthaea sp.]
MIAPEHTVATVFGADGAARPLASPAQISDVLAAEPDAFVWLDVVAADARDFAVIQEEFGLHPLAIEDALHSHQRPKIEAYGDTWFVVVYAATRRDRELALHEVAIFVGRHFAVTVRSAPAYSLDEFRRRWAHQRSPNRTDGGSFLYTLLDTIVDGYTPIGEAFEDHVEHLEAALLGEGTRTRDILLEIFDMKKNLAAFRRAVVPVRDILTPIMRGDIVLFVDGADELPYYRDVYDHVALVVDRLDAARDLINNARDTHIALASNRQNEISKQLTIVATIFLPLTFVTGFFGQNFGFLVAHITSTSSFWWAGVGSEVVALGALVAYFRFKGWF